MHFGEVASKMGEPNDKNYTPQEMKKFEAEVSYYIKVRDEVRLASGDYIDLKNMTPICVI